MLFVEPAGGGPTTAFSYWCGPRGVVRMPAGVTRRCYEADPDTGEPAPEPGTVYIDAPQLVVDQR